MPCRSSRPSCPTRGRREVPGAADRRRRAQAVAGAHARGAAGRHAPVRGVPRRRRRAGRCRDPRRRGAVRPRARHDDPHPRRDDDPHRGSLHRGDRADGWLLPRRGTRPRRPGGAAAHPAAVRHAAVACGGPVLTVADAALEEVVRQEWGRLVALLLSQFRRLDLVEDALGDALEAASRTWPVDGTPDNPAGWLMTTAKRRVLDRLRTEGVAQRKLPLLLTDAEHRQEGARTMVDGGSLVEDDVLRLVLMCAHPALAPE